MLTHALWLLSLGLSVFPVARRSKKPVVPWMRYQFEHATVEDARRWWAEGDNGIGVATGWVSRAIVVDTDSPEAEAWAVANLPATPRLTRTRRGLHRWYGHPGVLIGNKAKLEGVALDIRGDGGYVVGPGSVHPSGFVYEAIGDWEAPLPSLPPVLVRSARIRRHEVREVAPLSPEQQQTAVGRARAHAELYGPAIAGQGHHRRTMTLALTLFSRFRLSDRDALAVLAGWNEGNDPPRPERELERIVGWAQAHADVRP